MATDFQKQKKKQKYLLIAGIVIILITAGILYFSFFRTGNVEVKPIQAELIREITIKTTIFEDPFFNQNKGYIIIPEFEGKFGRENPFTPY